MNTTDLTHTGSFLLVRESTKSVQDRTPGSLALDDERALVERARTDRAAFGLLYDRYCPQIYAYAFHRLADRTLAEDVTSQTFTQALAAIGRYEDRGLPFASWLFRIAANVIASTFRRKVATVSLSPDDDESSQNGLAFDQTLRDEGAVDPNNEALRIERLAELRSTLALLPPDQRQALVLRFGRDMKIKEVADVMDRSEGAVKMLLMRGLGSMRRLLPPEDAHAH